MNVNRDLASHLTGFLSTTTEGDAWSALEAVPDDMWRAFATNASVMLHDRALEMNPFVGRSLSDGPVNVAELAGARMRQIEITNMQERLLKQYRRTRGF